LGMRGRRPTVGNVIPMRDEAAAAEANRKRAVRRLVSRLRPRGLDDDVKREWTRVATMLAAPTLDRLKPHYCDVIREYCVACVRIRQIREEFRKLAEQASQQGREVSPLQAETYRIKGRNGDQAKSHPLVAQLNECWREWRSLVAMLGLSPADERNMLPGQGDLFDESEREFA
jgi:P27 family predicted phage terminase small subunit